MLLLLGLPWRAAGASRDAEIERAEHQDRGCPTRLHGLDLGEDHGRQRPRQSQPRTLVRERRGPNHKPSRVTFLDALPPTYAGKPDEAAATAGRSSTATGSQRNVQIPEGVGASVRMDSRPWSLT
ncbi:hypothetical protein [Kitasatospora kifunensis]|uniref:Uncharacterized protein n=1 Tax=Kitasatospora kifunensis TaxID=58351 RepID=A0A7W7VYX1_KITKI|nr:hypothetical protein [Kitasatospora kifunensis]MBB4928167.1 hypothetical protein [Kitasatospora kifunensis]